MFQFARVQVKKRSERLFEVDMRSLADRCMIVFSSAAEESHKLAGPCNSRDELSASKRSSTERCDATGDCIIQCSKRQAARVVDTALMARHAICHIVFHRPVKSSASVSCFVALAMTISSWLDHCDREFTKQAQAESMKRRSHCSCCNTR